MRKIEVAKKNLNKVMRKIKIDWKKLNLDITKSRLPRKKKLKIVIKNKGFLEKVQQKYKKIEVVKKILKIFMIKIKVVKKKLN